MGSSSAGGRQAVVVPWFGLLVLAGGHFAVDCCTGIWPVFKTLAGLDLAKAGLIATIGSMVANGMQVLFGGLADRGWRKRFLVGGVACAGAVTFSPWTGSYLVMFALQLTTAFASAAYHPAATGAAAGVSRSRTGFVIGVFLAGGYGGYAFSQLLFSAAYHHSPALTPVIALLPLAVAIGIAIAVPGGPVRAAGVSTAGADGERRLRPRASWFVPLFMVQVFSTVASQSLVFLLPDLLAARAAPSWLVSGGGHFGLVVGSCLALLPAGHFADRFGARRVLMLGNAATGVLLAVLLSRTTASVVDLALVVAFGLFSGVNTVVTVAEGNRMYPKQASGVSALLMGLPWCVAAIGPVIAGVLAEPSRGGSPALALSWLGFAIPVALLAASFVPSRPRQ